MLFNRGDDHCFDLRQIDHAVIVVECECGDLVLVAKSGQDEVEFSEIDAKITAIYVEIGTFFLLEQAVFYEGCFTRLRDAIDLIRTLF